MIATLINLVIAFLVLPSLDIVIKYAMHNNWIVKLKESCFVLEIFQLKVFI